MTNVAWKRCGVCKRELGFDNPYYECSVSTCTSGRNHPVFCSVDCWNQHVPVMRHRDAWALQKRSPTRAQWEQSEAAATGASPAGAGSGSRPGVAAPARGDDAAVSSGAPRRILVRTAGEPASAPSAAPVPEEILIVASKLKAYIRARSGMNTSDGVMERLSDIVRHHADRAIEHARQASRRTVMDRDFPDDEAR